MFKKIYIEITNICNLKCKFCPDTSRTKKFMEASNFENVLKKIAPYTNLICLHVKGEPLLHPELEKILKIAENYNLKVNITTNGTLIKEKLNIVKEAKAIRQINFSLHSITQNDSFNKDYLYNIFTSVEQLQNIIISFRLWNTKKLQDNSINKEIIEEIQKYYKIQNLDKILKQKSYFKLRENIFINQDLEFKWPNIKGEPIIKEARCLALKEQIAILVDGTVVPCCLDNNGDIPLGNIFNESLEEIMSKEKTQNIKKNFENRNVICKLCKTCGFLKNLEEKRKCT